MPMKKIAIIGATGMLGQPVTKEFIQNGFKVSILARNKEKAKNIFGSEPDIWEGDLKDINILKDFLIGQDGLYLNLSVEQASSFKEFQPEREGLENIILASKNSSIKRIGYLSSLVHFYNGEKGFNWWVFDIKKDAVNKIKNNSIPYSIFYPSTFMESFDKGAYRQGNMIALAGTSKYKMHLISGRDYGRQVVKSFQMDDGNQDYIVQGREGFTADEAAQFYVKNLINKKIKVVKAPLQILSFLGMFGNKFSYGAHIIKALNNYPERFEATKTWERLGKPKDSFLDYINNAQ